MTETTNKSDLDTMLPAENTLTIGGEVIEVRQIKMKQFNQILQLAAPLISVLRTHSANIKSADELKAMLTQVYMTNPGELTKLVSICVNKPVDWVEELDIDVALSLMMKIVEANLDFFIERMLPLLLDAVKRVRANPAAAAKVAQYVGQMTSSFSSEQDTATQQSLNTPTASS